MATGCDHDKYITSQEFNKLYCKTKASKFSKQMRYC